MFRGLECILQWQELLGREGYPQLDYTVEKAAWEEAEHAAKFAELLGRSCLQTAQRRTGDA